MPGHMGDRTVTTPAMVVIRVAAAQNLLMIKGSVPGSNEGLVLIRRSMKPPKVVRPGQQPKKNKAAASGAKPAAKPAAPAAKKK